MPPPVIITTPCDAGVTDCTSFVPPSMSVSFASTSIAAAGSSSVTVAESATATGGSSTQVTVTDTVAVEPPVSACT